MKSKQFILAALLGLFLATALSPAPALADGGDTRNQLRQLQKEEDASEKRIEHGIFIIMHTEFDLTLRTLVIFNLTMLESLRLREIRIQKAILSRELLHTRMREFFLRTPLGVAYSLQSLALFTMLGTPPYTALAYNFDPILWQTSVALMTYYFVNYLFTPEGQLLVANLTEAMSYGQYGYDAVYNTQYAE